MKGIGKMIYNMDMEKRFGQIIRNMKVNTMKEKSMVKGFMSGQMVVCMRESGMRTELKEKECTPGLMEDNTQVSGRIITCMGSEDCITRITNLLMKEIGSLTSSTVMAKFTMMSLP